MIRYYCVGRIISTTHWLLEYTLVPSAHYSTNSLISIMFKFQSCILALALLASPAAAMRDNEQVRILEGHNGTDHNDTDHNETDSHDSHDSHDEEEEDCHAGHDHRKLEGNETSHDDEDEDCDHSGVGAVSLAFSAVAVTAAATLSGVF